MSTTTLSLLDDVLEMIGEAQESESPEIETTSLVRLTVTGKNDEIFEVEYEEGLEDDARCTWILGRPRLDQLTEEQLKEFAAALKWALLTGDE